MMSTMRRDDSAVRARAALDRGTATVRRLGRRVTASRRRLPDFIVIGAQRCGTTSLYEYLTEHPAILPASRKEVHYFDVHYDRGSEWYRTHFPLAGDGSMTGEATPYYLAHPLVPLRVRALLPEVRLVVMLRDPVERAVSHYHHEVSTGDETLPLETALAVEGKRLDGEEDRLRSRTLYRSNAHQHFGYVARGHYAEQLERWFALFPREQILVLNSNALFADPPGHMRRVFDFLGLPDRELPAYRIHNSRSYELDAALRNRLAAAFVPSNQRLYALLGEDFGWSRPA
jgi:hypothetical protein